MGNQKFKHKMKCKLPAVKYIGTALKLDYPMMRNKKACLYKHALSFGCNDHSLAQYETLHQKKAYLG